MMNSQVEGVFFDEEVFMQGVATLEAVVQRADIATGAEGFLAGAAQHHGMHLGILGPGAQMRRKAADHVQGDGIEAGGAVEGQVADMVAYFGQDAVLGGLGAACRLGLSLSSHL
jgi:hypothetical protein